MLSRMQLRVAALVARDLTNGQIARELDIRETTVKTHVAKAIHTLKLGSRVGLALWYDRRHGRRKVSTTEKLPQAMWIAGRAATLEDAGVPPAEALRAAEAAWNALPEYRRRFYVASTPERPCFAVIGPEGAN